MTWHVWLHGLRQANLESPDHATALLTAQIRHRPSGGDWIHADDFQVFRAHFPVVPVERASVVPLVKDPEKSGRRKPMNMGNGGVTKITYAEVKRRSDADRARAS